jgi:hypothetical protein
MGLFLAKFGLDPVVRPYVNGSGMLWKLLNLATTFGRDRWDQHYRF